MLTRRPPVELAPALLPVRVPAQRRPAHDDAPVRAPRGRRPTALLALLLVALVPALTAATGPAPAAAPHVRACLFGDSLMAGTGAVPRRPVMAQVAAARLGWEVVVDAWGGTGYTTTGHAPGYLERLARPGALAGRCDVVVLEGGTNDAHAATPPAQVRAAVHAVVAEVRRRHPQAQVVLMGAYDPPGVVDLRRGVADAAVRAAADDLGLPFFSPRSGRWVEGQDPGRFLHADGLHPNERGYGVLGGQLAASLAEALPGLASRGSSYAPQAASSAP